MAHGSDLIPGNTVKYLKQHGPQQVLRFITCGSADDGQATLLARLLSDSRVLFDDPLADTFEREQLLLNMVTGAATVDVAVILIDARKGILTQTRRYSFLVSLIGIKQIVLAVNKMDLVNFDQDTFDSIEAEYRDFAAQICLQDITAIPLSALDGDNMISHSERMPWYQGHTLMDYLETCEVDVSRGNDMSAADSPSGEADQFECHIVWMADQPMFVGRAYRLKIGAQLVNMNITALKHKLNVNSLEHVAATELALNEIAVCNISLDRSVAFEAYDSNREMGGFILIDRLTEQTVGVGMIHFALRRSQNIHQQHFDVDIAARAAQKGQSPVVLWFTGLSGAGKSTIANLVERQLFALGRHSYLLDGDNVRHGLNRDLGFTDADRVENIRRVSEVARLMIDSGLIVLTAFISPFRAERIRAKQTIGPDHFYEIYIDTPLAVAEQRDVKGLYKKARSGQLKNFTGIDSPYEIPIKPELVVSTESETPEQSAAQVIEFLKKEGII